MADLDPYEPKRSIPIVVWALAGAVVLAVVIGLLLQLR